MHRHEHWAHYWWAILQHFGRECKKTWGAEVTAVVVGGLAGAGASYLRSHGHVSFWDTTVDGLITAALFFGLYVFAHLLRSPWLERKSEGIPPSVLDGLIGGVLFFMLLGGGALICRLIAWDWQSDITLHSSTDYPTQLIELNDCKSKVAAFSKPEPPDSLRRRTIRLVSDLSKFWSQRPMPAQQPVQNPTTDEEHKRNSNWDRYWMETKAAYVRHDFSGRILGIVREYKNKGVPIGFLETEAEQPDRLVGALPYGGFALDNCAGYANDACQLRELAFHVDARDQAISPDF
jgi:hypothetical protein